MNTTPLELYSIGHSNGPLERLVALLHAHKIVAVCDVRSVPYSRYTPQFNREALAEELPGNGVSYYWLGDSLGGLHQRPDVGEQGVTDDENPAFQRGLNQLVALGEQAPTVFMCAEADYHGCHRSRLITPALLRRGIVVWHILADGKREAGHIEPQQMRMF